MRDLLRYSLTGLLLLSGCDGGEEDPPRDAGPDEIDAGPSAVDGGPAGMDAGPFDAGGEEPKDSGPQDAGPTDAGILADAARPDGGPAPVVRCMGTVSAVIADRDPFGGDVGGGDPVMIEFALIPGTADSDGASNTGRYVMTSDPARLTLSVESWSFAPDPGFIDCEVYTANDHPTFHDNFEVDCYAISAAPPIGGPGETNAWVLLRDTSDAWRSSDALPTDDWGAFTTGEFGVDGYDFEGNSWQFGGTIESCE